MLQVQANRTSNVNPDKGVRARAEGHEWASCFELLIAMKACVEEFFGVLGIICRFSNLIAIPTKTCMEGLKEMSEPLGSNC